MTTPDIPDAVISPLRLERETDVYPDGTVIACLWFGVGIHARVRFAATPGEVEALEAALEADRALAVAAGRAQAAADIERPDSVLCDCGNADYPTNPMTNLPMDHHCDCSAVRAAATMLGAYSATVHARQCGHGTEHDGFYVQAAGGETR